MELSKQENFTWLIVGAVLSAIGVALGAFGAHGLESFVDGRVADPQKSVEIWTTASRYWMYHSLAICLVGVTSLIAVRSTLLDVACVLFSVGMLLFSGCLFGLALTETGVLGAIVPLGGLSLIIGWLTFAIALGFASRSANRDRGWQ